MRRYGEEGLTDLSYQAGMLMFADLFDRVGAATFDRIIGGFYREHGEDGASTDDFVRFANKTAGGGLETFFADWLDTTAWQAAIL